MSGPFRLARGDVVLVSFPFTDLSASKLRPALVVGRVSDEDAILAFITSRMATGDPHSECLLDPSDAEFAATGLKAPSLVRLNKLATLHRDLIRRRLGHVGPHTTQAVAAGLRYVFEL